MIANDEYLIFKQVAFLLDASIESVAMIKTLTPEVRHGVKMIKASNLKDYVYPKIKKLALVAKYDCAFNKEQFWIQHQRAYPKIYGQKDKLTFDYLTLSQVAYLLNMKSGSVRHLLFRGFFKSVIPVCKNKKSILYLIPFDEVLRYANEQVVKYKKVIDYLNCNDTSVWWMNHGTEYEEWQKKNRERKNLYEQKRKIQRQNCRANQV